MLLVILTFSSISSFSLPMEEFSGVPEEFESLNRSSSLISKKHSTGGAVATKSWFCVFFCLWITETGIVLLVPVQAWVGPGAEGGDGPGGLAL